MVVHLAAVGCAESGDGSAVGTGEVAGEAGGAADGGDAASQGGPSDGGLDERAHQSTADAEAGSAAERAEAPGSGSRGELEAAAQRDAGGSSTQPAQGAVDVDNFSRQLAAALCSALRQCLGEQKLHAFVDGEVCETRFAATFAQTDFGTLDDSLQRGRVELHEDLFEQCYADTRALGCAVQTERLPSSCQQALKGTVPAGETCSSGADCTGGHFCPATECPRVCTARRASAESCIRDEECETGLICVGGQCAAPAALGEPCAGKSAGVCALGASCVGSTQEQAGQCVANTDVQVGAVGEVCTPGGTLCREGLSCAYDGAAGFSCQEPVASGEACHLALPTQCPRSEYCTAPDVTTEGRCSALPADGEACVLGSECAGGHVCLADGDAVTCTRLRDLGETCSQAAMCRSGRCAQGQCAASEVCD